MNTKCTCGEDYDFEGWNINEEARSGNNYLIKRDETHRIKYTICSKCGKEVILSKEQFIGGEK